MPNLLTDVPTVDTIEDGRAAIDEIDAALRSLIATRRTVSERIQALRKADGGPRISHARENQVIGAYADELGASGVEIAKALLTLCRGPVSGR